MKTILNFLFKCALIVFICMMISYYTKPTKLQEKLSKGDYSIITIQQDSLTFNFIK